MGGLLLACSERFFWELHRFEDASETDDGIIFDFFFFCRSIVPDFLTYFFGSSSEDSIILYHSRIDQKCGLIASSEGESFERTDSRESDISLPRDKSIRKIHHGTIEGHPLGFMDGNSPGKPEGDLRDFCFWFATFFDYPPCVISDDHCPIFELDDGKSLLTTDDVTDGAIHVSSFEIIFHEHDSSSDLEDERFWGETSFFQGFHEFLGSFRLHFEDENITRKLIELIRIVGIDRYISREKLGMIFGLDWDVPTFEKLSRTI